MTNILITAGNHPTAGLISFLLQSEYRVISGDSENSSFSIPNEDSASYAHQLLSLCLSNNIEYVIPLKENEVFALSEAKVLFSEYDIQVLIPTLKQLRNLNRIEGEGIVNTLTIEEIAHFSKGLLDMGYPDKTIAVGSLDSKGRLIKIDDTVSDKINIWDLPDVSSFIQVNKLLKSNNWTGIIIYELQDPHIFTFSVLRINNKLHSYPNLNLEQEKIISQVLEANKLDGLYEISLNGRNIIRIKNQIV
ncbi:ATP-grasp domain-containing protein [Pseudopedobacter saltans]|uniref:hypothetical protein n=1 Tax=Pseudopedobacter saltans TaxID=151895 RepID=UPI0002DAEC33|nr:hypothetical protein [Pseudopedobacter saltans]